MTKSRPVFLITGAGKGIGRGIVEELVDRSRHSGGTFSPRLYLTSRTAEDLASLQILAQGAGLECRVHAEDLALPDVAVNLAAEAERAWGGVDCLINNAGVGRFGRYDELTEADVDFVLATNLKATFLLTQKIFSAMEKRRRGHVFFVTSVSAEKPFESSAIYCMSKYGQKGLVDVLRLYAYKCGVRITNVMPGPVLTPMWGEIPKEQAERMIAPRDVAKALVDAYFSPSNAVIEELVIRPVMGDL